MKYHKLSLSQENSSAEVSSSTNVTEDPTTDLSEQGATMSDATVRASPPRTKTSTSSITAKSMSNTAPPSERKSSDLKLGGKSRTSRQSGKASVDNVVSSQRAKSGSVTVRNDASTADFPRERKNSHAKSSSSRASLPDRKKSNESGTNVQKVTTSDVNVGASSPLKKTSTSSIIAKSLSNAASPGEKKASDLKSGGASRTSRQSGKASIDNEVSIQRAKSSSATVRNGASTVDNAVSIQRVKSGSATVRNGASTTDFPGERKNSHAKNSSSRASLSNRKKSTESETDERKMTTSIFKAASNISFSGEEKNGRVKGSNSRRSSLESKVSSYNSSKSSSFDGGGKPSPQKVLPQSTLKSSLPACQQRRTNVGKLKNPIDLPRIPKKYTPPFRRNYRYFGYPDDLNLEMNTPPRVRSWGPIVAPPTRVKPARQHFTPSIDSSKPSWMGSTLKNSILLLHPALLPVIQKNKAVKDLGKKPVQLVKPELEFTDCVSQLYFPLGEKSRQAFCRINKRVQENISKEIHDFAVQHHTTVVWKKTEEEIGKEDPKLIKRKMTQAGVAEDKKRDAKKFSRFSMADFQLKSAYDRYYEDHAAPPIMKSFCLSKMYPGQNRQLYGKPRFTEKTEQDTKEVDERPITGVARVPDLMSHISQDIWEKIYKARARRRQSNNNEKGKNLGGKKFRVFDALELRNQVLEAAKENFLNDLKHDIHTPFPPELYHDNRGSVQPPHDYSEGELPAQGPFAWKIDPEDPATENEQLIVEAYLEEMKEHHISRHPPGIVHAKRQPFDHFELDWIEEGCEIRSAGGVRKTPTKIQKLPEYVMNLDAKSFAYKLERMVSETAKDLVGPQIYAMYKRGIRERPSISESDSRTEFPLEEEGAIQGCKVREAVDDHSDSDSDHSDEEDNILEEDVKEPEHLPMPNIRFSHIDFPNTDVPEHLREEIEVYNRRMERALPVRKDEDEPKEEESDSDTSTPTEEDSDEFPLPELSAQSKSTSHHRVMDVEALKHKLKKLGRKSMKAEPLLERAGLKHVFFDDENTKDVDEMWELVHDNKTKLFPRFF